MLSLKKKKKKKKLKITKLKQHKINKYDSQLL